MKAQRVFEAFEDEQGGNENERAENDNGRAWHCVLHAVIFAHRARSGLFRYPGISHASGNIIIREIGRVLGDFLPALRVIGHGV